VTGARITRRTLDAAGLLPVAAAGFAALSMLHLWWTVPTAIAMFLAGRRPGRTGLTVLVLVAVLALGVVALSLRPSWLPLAGRFVAVMVAATMAPWFAGRFWWQWQQLARIGWERAEQAHREQWLVAEQARLRERARIAQDMHDVLGHDLSLIAVSAGALKLAPGLAEQHRRAAGEIRTRAADAVERLGEVIGVLRTDAGGAPAQTRGTDLTALVAEAAAAGLRVTLRTDRVDEGLPPVAGLALHRVVQEALTNVAKHAPGAAATVQVTHAEAETTVVVENDPPPVPPPPPGGGSGSGLVGLAERVRLAGGSFDHGPRDGGFTVTARIPHRPTTPPAPPPPSIVRELPARRRRIRRSLVVAVMVPLLTGAVLSGALMGWETLSASRAVLPPGDYARLRIGQDRSEVAGLLPARQTGHRPLTTEPAGEGITCEYYAMTADRFDDRSGDAYRLCFRHGTLMSLDAVTP
jgi:signal transduction histidine kinase